MTREYPRSASSRPGGISRREFIKLAAMASLLAGCLAGAGRGGA